MGDKEFQVVFQDGTNSFQVVFGDTTVIAQENAVLYTPQTLTDEQQAQARSNIGIEGVLTEWFDAANFSINDEGHLIYTTPTDD